MRAEELACDEQLWYDRCMQSKTSYTYTLNEDGQTRLLEHLRNGNYTLSDKEHARISAKGDLCSITLYNSGKCLIQGKGAADWVTFTMEPDILQEVGLGYEAILDPAQFEPHMGIDESGKGDFFGPLVIAAAYVDRELIEQMTPLGVRDSKSIKSDRKIAAIAKDLRAILKTRFAVVTIGPVAYNRLYEKIGNVNKLLAWGHARAIENLLEKVPTCPRALSDQFGPKQQIKNALLKKGRSIELEQKHKAESDPAVAAASILARDAFVHALQQLGRSFEEEIPKGASAKVKITAGTMITKHGPKVLLETAKCHFKTAAEVLAANGFSREDLRDT